MTLKPISRSLILIILLVSLLTAVLPASAQENKPGLTMAVQAGYDGLYKVNNIMPVIVTVANDGPAIEGELRIEQGTKASGNHVVYNTPVSLPTQSSKRIFMYIYPTGFNTQITVELQDRNGRSLLKTLSNTISQMPPDSLLYGVVTPQAGNLDYLQDVIGTRAEAAVAYLKLDELPDLPPAWNSLDVLIVHDVDTGQLTTAQLDALTSWLNTGGQLVVAGGPGWQKTSAALADLLPVTITGSETVDDLPALQTAVGEPFRDPGPYLLTNSSLTKGELLLHEEGMPLVAQRPFNQGTVTFLALDPGLAPLMDWAGSKTVWGDIIKTLPLASSWTIGFQNTWAAVAAVSSLPTLHMPPVWQLAGYLLIYILIIGPLNYVILKRKNQLVLAWVTIPLLSILFSGVAYLTGFQLKGNDTIVNQMSVATGLVGSDDVRVSTLLGLYSPRRRSYDVILPISSMARPLEEYASNATSLEAITRSNDLVLTDVRVDVSGIETFVAESIQPSLPIYAQASLAVQDGDIELTVTVRNDSEVPLQDVTILANSYAVALGDLAPGAELSTTEVVGSAGLTGSSSLSSTGYGSPLMANANIILDTADYYNDREAYPRWQLLQALENGYLTGKSTVVSTQVTLLAWSDVVQLETAVADQEPNTFSTTLYLLEMPIKQELSSGRLTVPMNLLNWTILGSNNIYSETVQDFYMENASWLEVAFRPWQELEDMTIDEITILLSTQYSDTGDSLVPTVRLWDWAAEEWLDLDDVVWGETAVPDPQRFLSDNNTIRLRLQNQTGSYLNIHEFYPLLTGELD